MSLSKQQQPPTKDSDAGEMDEKLRHLIRCPICYDNFTRDRRAPICLPCGHTFCSTCCNRIVFQNLVCCCICQKVSIFGPAPLRRNLQLLQILEFANLLDPEPEDQPAAVVQAQPIPPNAFRNLDERELLRFMEFCLVFMKEYMDHHNRARVRAAGGNVEADAIVHRNEIRRSLGGITESFAAFFRNNSRGRVPGAALGGVDRLADYINPHILPAMFHPVSDVHRLDSAFYAESNRHLANAYRQAYPQPLYQEPRPLPRVSPRLPEAEHFAEPPQPLLRDSLQARQYVPSVRRPSTVPRQPLHRISRQGFAASSSSSQVHVPQARPPSLVPLQPFPRIPNPEHQSRLQPQAEQQAAFQPGQWTPRSRLFDPPQ